SCSSAAQAAMHSFSSNGSLLAVESMHSASRLQTSLPAGLRGSVQPAHRSLIANTIASTERMSREVYRAIERGSQVDARMRRRARGCSRDTPYCRELQQSVFDPG